MSQLTKEKLDDASKPLKLNKLYEEFFSKDTTSKFDDYCKDLKKYNDTHKGAQELCVKLVRFVKKISEWTNKPESVKYCDYLHYWLYDEIKEIYKEHKKKLGEIPFSKELIDIGNRVNKEIKKNNCVLKHERYVGLDELIKRKYAYIYYNKQNDIKNTINSQSTYDCNKYFTYLTNIKSLYDKIYNDNCKPSFWYSPLESDYFSCKKTNDPKDLLSTTEKCKAKVSGSGGSTFLGILFGGSSARTGTNGKGELTQAPTRTAGLGTQKPGRGCHLAPAGSQMARGVTAAASRFPKRKRKKKIFEHNYYEEYEKELAKYGSEDMSLYSEDDRYYLNYQHEGDYDYYIVV
ncbi:PIR protein [Plasmodium vivax]|uniref:VIR protein n=1 Tax=Plasmodium vivax TaxID=5855 RepID=A0A565A694_PLAVI|nr:PIR protein [Plasmodium vivax]